MTYPSETYYRKQQETLVKSLARGAPPSGRHTTVIPMKQDYSHSSLRCLTTVSFIPLDLAGSIWKQVTERLRRVEPNHYYYPPSDMHVTIKNVRKVACPPTFTRGDAMRVAQEFKKVMPSLRRFCFHISGMIIFPTSIALVAYSSAYLSEVIHRLDNVLREIGIPDDKEYVSDSVFFGNVSLVRFVKEPARELVNVAREIEGFEVGKLEVSKCALVICDEVCSASTREIISEFSLSP